MGFRLQHHFGGQWTLGGTVIVIPDLPDDEAVRSLDNFLSERGAGYNDVYVDSPEAQESARVRFSRTFRVGDPT
jgi:hypothetical protein